MPEQTPSKNPSGADNEQGSPTDLAWLAGHIDGDGYIGIIRRMRSSTRRYYRYSASIAIMTTSDRNAEKCRRILRGLGVNFNDRVIDAYRGKDGSPRRAKYNLQLVGNAGGEIALRAILPHLAEKRECASIVLDYIEWRKTADVVYGGRGKGSKAVEMQEKAEQFMELLRLDRNRADPSETTRLAPVAKSRRYG